MMRRQLTMAAVLGVLAAGCSSETVAAPPPAPVDWHAMQAARTSEAGKPAPTAKERAVAEGYASALTAPDFPRLGSLLDPDAHFAFPGMAEAYDRDAVVKAHAALFGAFDQRALGLSRIWRTDRQQTLEWTMTGVQARDWMGVPATHKPVGVRGLTLLSTKDDGTITDVHVYFDVMVVKAQLGAGPKELENLPLPSIPAAPPQVFEQTGSPDEAANVTAVRAHLDALEKKDEAAFLGTVTDDVQIETLGRAQPMRGKDDVKAYFKAMHKAIGQLDTTLDNAWGVTRFAIVEYFISGEQLGPIGWIPAQRDKVLKLQVADVVEVTGGKIAHIWRYDDPAQIAAGGNEAPPPAAPASTKAPGSAAPATSARTPGAPATTPRTPTPSPKK
jgi:steroid delta-isomerase-like uncharacterized protein